MADHLPKNIRETLEQIKNNVPAGAKAQKLLQKLDVQLAAMVPAKGGGEMRVESMVASGSKNPEITFTWGENKGQLSVTAAKGYAMQILESCEAAVQDAALFRAITSTEGGLGKDAKEAEQMAWAMITLVRKHRGHFEQGGE